MMVTASRMAPLTFDDRSARKPCRSSDRFRLGDGLLILAALAQATADGAIPFGGLLDHERCVALGTRLGDRAFPGGELACRVAVAAEEDLAAARALLHRSEERRVGKE